MVRLPPQHSRGQGASRVRLLKAAKRLFAAQGYEQTATSAVARDAGTSESQLMRYFGGKVGVLEALFDEAWSDINARLQRVGDGQASYRDTILGILEVVTSAFARDPDLATLLLFEGRRLRGDAPRVRLSAGFMAFTDHVKGLVRKGQASGEFDRALDAAALASSLIGAAESMIRDRLLARLSGGRGFAGREVARTLDAMLRGFSRPRRAHANDRAPTARATRRGLRAR